MPGKPRVESPEVIAKAENFGVDLAQVVPMANGDRITGGDVFRTALAQRLGLKPSATVAEINAGLDVLDAIKKRREEAAAAAAVPAVHPASGLAAAVAGRGPAFALNPLVDKVRAEAARASRSAPDSAAPSLFPGGGDIPAFTASGIPPESVLQVPWEARHAMAAAATSAEAYGIVTSCSGPNAEATAHQVYGDHDGNADYAERVERWRLEGLSDAELGLVGSTAAREEQNRRISAMPELPEADLQTIDKLIGPGAPGWSGNGREAYQFSPQEQYR